MGGDNAGSERAVYMELEEKAGWQGDIPGCSQERSVSTQVKLSEGSGCDEKAEMSQVK